jgi:putative DNA primase/helicase
LQGARLALANEVGQGVTWDDQKVKEVTSRERISARRLYQEATDFMPTHKLWIRGNHQPTIQDASDGMWRRIVMIPFTRQFVPGEQTPGLERVLFDSERNGILAWAVRGCLEFQKFGLSPPEPIAKALNVYRSESDVLGQWMEECCVLNGRVTVGEAYTSWRSFNERSGMMGCSQPAFTRRMTQRRVDTTKSNGQKFFLGLAIRKFDDDNDDL